MEEDAKSISPYAEGTETQLSIQDFRGADNDGKGCSKIAVTYQEGKPYSIVIYE